MTSGVEMARNAAEALLQLQELITALPNATERAKFQVEAVKMLKDEVKDSDDGERANQLKMIIATIKNSVPFDGLSPAEKMIFPGGESHLAGQNEYNTQFVDSFLYDDDDIDCLVEDGSLSRYYSTDDRSFGSRKVAALTFLSHSFSMQDLKFIYSDAVLGDLSGKTVLDVGSRLGAVLYYGYLYSKAEKLVGVEMNEFFDQLQAKVVSDFGMGDRISLCCSDICEQAELLQKADVIVMHNVFDFFCDKEVVKQIWGFLMSAIHKTDCRLVCSPSLDTCLESAGMDSAAIEQWADEIPLVYPRNPDDDDSDEEEDEENDLAHIHLYKVKPRSTTTAKRPRTD